MNKIKSLFLLSIVPLITYVIWIILIVYDVLGHTISHQQIAMYCIAVFFAYLWDYCIFRCSEEDKALLQEIWHNGINTSAKSVRIVSILEMILSIILLIVALNFHTIYPTWKYIKIVYVIYVIVNIMLDIVIHMLDIKNKDKY